MSWSCNNRLYKFGYVESPMCSLCSSETETMTHLFCNCSKTDQMWNSLTSWYKGCLTLPVLEPSAAILGFFDVRDEKSRLINHILILFKFFLYANRNIKHTVNFHALKLFISSVQKIENKIAFNGNKLDQHLSKWQQIAHLVDLKKCRLMKFERSCGVSVGPGCMKALRNSRC